LRYASLTLFILGFLFVCITGVCFSEFYENFHGMMETIDYLAALNSFQKERTRYASLTLMHETENKRLFKALDLDSNREVMLKLVADKDEASCELDALELTNGRYHVVKLLDWAELDDCTLFVEEYVPRIDFIPGSTIDVALYGFQTLEALHFLHANMITHADIKPDNIIVNSQKIVTLIDFGFAIDGIVVETLRGHVGTSHYMAPEVVSHQPIGPPADIWSLGVTLNDMVQSGSYKEDFQTPIIKSLISRMLETDPHARITAEAAKEKLLNSFPKNNLCPCCGEM